MTKSLKLFSNTRDEQRSRNLCQLAGVPYYTPCQRLMRKYKSKISDWWFFAVHAGVAYTLWGIMKIVPQKYEEYWFNTFEVWCFCHTRKTK